MLTEGGSRSLVMVNVRDCAVAARFGKSSAAVSVRVTVVPLGVDGGTFTPKARVIVCGVGVCGFCALTLPAVVDKSSHFTATSSRADAVTATVRPAYDAPGASNDSMTGAVFATTLNDTGCVSA